MDLSLVRGTLKKAGLSEKAIELYLTLSKMGETTPPELGREVGMKRPTVHAILKELSERGLIGVRDTGKNSKPIRAASPHVLLGEYRELLTSLERVLPSINDLRKHSIEEPSYELYLGRDGLLRLWREMGCAQTDLSVVYDQRYSNGLQIWMGEKGDRYTEESISVRIRNKVFLKGIIPYARNPSECLNPEEYEAQGEFLELRKKGAQELRDYRFLPRTLIPMDVELGLWDDKLSLAHYGEGVVMVITSKFLVSVLQPLFNVAFEHAGMTELKNLSKKDLKYLDLL